MEIQERLLLEQIGLVANSPLGKVIMKGKNPQTMEEFRQVVPLTTYEDYEPYIGTYQEDMLAEKPCFWSHTSGRSGRFKWVPWTSRAEEIWCKNLIGAFILAAASKKNEVNFGLGERILLSLAPRPYISGYIGLSFWRRFTCRLIPPLEEVEEMELWEKAEKGFSIGLKTGVDCVLAMASVLVKTGEAFEERHGGRKFSLSMLHPAVSFRLVRALLRSRLVERRQLLPKDLWPVKGIVGWGVDMAIYKNRIAHYWGRTPYELYAFSEAGTVAEQSWTKKEMVFLPDVAFLEFIPEEEGLRNREDPTYQPATVLLNEVEAGQQYELVITNFYGMPFLRYRVGDLFSVTSLQDEETGIKMPHVVYHARARDLIDIAGFTRLGQKTIWRAISNTGLKYEEWTIRKEYDHSQPIMHLYVELKEKVAAEEVEQLVHQQLKAIDADYSNLESMLGIWPLRVTILPLGSFQRYYEEKHKAGADLAHLRPPHMNASDEVIGDLLRLSGRG